MKKNEEYINVEYRKTNFQFISETAFRVVRAFAVFYMVVTPLLEYKNTRLVIGTVLLCLGIIGTSNLLLGKIRQGILNNKI